MTLWRLLPRQWTSSNGKLKRRRSRCLSTLAGTSQSTSRLMMVALPRSLLTSLAMQWNSRLSWARSMWRQISTRAATAKTWKRSSKIEGCQMDCWSLKVNWSHSITLIGGVNTRRKKDLLLQCLIMEVLQLKASSGLTLTHTLRNRKTWTMGKWRFRRT